MVSMDKKEDAYLAKAIADGNEDAFRVIFDRYKRSVYATAYKWSRSKPIAEDLTQDVFIKLWNHRSLLLQVDNFKAYIYKATFNATNNWFRSHMSREKALKGLPTELDSNNNIQEKLDLQESQQLIKSALTQLSKQKQLIFKLAKNDGKSYKEIADTLNISPETVRSHLYETMRFLKQYLKGHSPILLLILLERFH